MSWMIFISIVCIAVTIGINGYFFYQQKKMMDGLTHMLETAMDGTFCEQSFDESRQSALENQLAQYLKASELSVRNIASEREKIKELIADISHQTRTPLSNILLYAELLEEEIPSGNQDSLQKLHQQTEKLQFLIDGLVKLSRLETGIIVLHSTVGRLDDMVVTVEKIYRDKVRQKGLRLVVDSRDETEPCLAAFDEKWSLEALNNIMDNAIKYTKAGSITITLRAYEMFACVEIADTGIGIPEEERGAIFKRFYRGNDVAQEEGVGIGLYLAREIMEQQGGYIKVSSKVGEGSVFGLYFPKAIVSKL